MSCGRREARVSDLASSLVCDLVIEAWLAAWVAPSALASQLLMLLEKAHSPLPLLRPLDPLHPLHLPRE